MDNEDGPTIAAIQEGLQRSLARILQVLRGPPARQLRSVTVPLERGTHGNAGALIRLVRGGHHVTVGQRPINQPKIGHIWRDARCSRGRSGSSAIVVLESPKGYVMYGGL